MFRTLLSGAFIALVLVPPATAGGISVSASPNPVAVGNSFTVEICGTGGRTVNYAIIYPDDSQVTGQFYTGFECGTLPPVLASQAGEYQIVVLNKNGNHIVASATITAQ